MKNKLLYLFAAMLFFAACEPKIQEFEASAGDADFSKYISVGNSLTAGYADGALYKSAQEFSYPNILAGQFSVVGGGDFVQPVVESEFGVLPGKRKLGISVDCKGVPGLGPVSDAGTLSPLAPVGYAVNNFGVPGAKSYHLLAPGYGNPANLLTVPPTANPYFVRFASSTATSVVADAAAANASFFSLWIGNNDVLGYATAGGEGNILGEVITPAPMFNGAMDMIVTALTANGAKGVMANIPDVTDVPFFTTVPYNGLYIDDATAQALNGAYAQVEAAIQQMGVPGFKYNFTFKAGYNAFVIEDREFPIAALPKAFKVRQAVEGELILLTLPQDSLKCHGMGSFSLANSKPFGIPAKFVLDAAEVANIKNAVAGFNTKLKELADAKGLAFVDMNANLKNLKSGMYFDGQMFTTKFVTGGVFSLDGIHLNAQGNAIVSNYFIDAINAKYNSIIPKVEITSYPGLKFP